ncbi:MAG: DUF554 domain-containing protein [Trueperaceae bacterium]|nr:DUF554 domain-containing protein [Trueperaceae bacterium]
MNPLDQVSGTIWNVVAVVLGTSLGLAVRGRLDARFTAVLMQAVGLVTIFIGIENAGDLSAVRSPPGLILGLVALAIGAVLGEWLRLEDRLDAVGAALQRRVRGHGRFTEGFVAASLLFCVGPLTIVGSLQNGLTGDDAFLLLKSTLDGISSIALAATFGVGVMASALVVLLYQGALSLGAGAIAGHLGDPATDPRVLLVNGVGGLMIVGLGITLLELRRMSVASMLPALVIVVILYELVTRAPLALLGSP